MGIMMLAWLVILVAVGVTVVRFAARQLPPASTVDQDRRLAEHIEELEEELERVKEQADFTEKLLTERSGSPPPKALDDGDDLDSDRRPG